MLNLIKTELRRIIKDKLFMVIGIIGIVFAIVTPLLMFGVSSLLDEKASQLLGMSIDAKMLFFEAFNPVSDFGLVALVLLCIILCKDFSQGTVRNKIISGKSRFSVFTSSFIASTIILCALMLIYAFATLCVSLIFFEYQSTPFTANDFGYAVVTLVFKIMTFIVISALVSFLSVFMKNAGLCMVMLLAITMLASIIGTVLSTAIIGVEDGIVKNILEILIKTNVFLSTVTGTGVTYSLSDVLCVVLSHIVLGALFYLLGVVVFKKKDIK
ncbi:MAG: hypothetical protein E7353_07070 [Clostridiales bacterium]|nr:hypothetical protein [Clostridiales bacterium]